MSRDAAYFDALYAHDPDPWRFEDSAYEAEKYATTLAALPPGRFATALELGCSIGVFTAQLALRCDRLLALDVAEAALARARARCADLPNVELQLGAVPDAWPQGDWDLLVFSEILYFLTPEALGRTAKLARTCLAPGGTIVLVNWRGETDTALSGEAAAELFIAAIGLPTITERRPGYRLDTLAFSAG